MFENCVNSKKQGDVGLGIAISYFVSNGFTVSIPLTDSQDYDLIVDNGNPKRVQVKTTSFIRNGNYTVGLSTKGGNRSGSGKIKKFNKNSVELVFIITSNNSWYCIPSSEINCVSSITLSENYDKFKVAALQWDVSESVKLAPSG